MGAIAKATASFVAIVVSGSAILAIFDAFVLGNVDGKLVHDSAGEFMLIFGMGLLLAVGSTVSVALIALAFRRRVAAWPYRFASVAALLTLGVFVTRAFVPLMEWLEPVMPRSVLYPLGTAFVIGIATAGVALLGCIAFPGEQVPNSTLDPDARKRSARGSP